MDRGHQATRACAQGRALVGGSATLSIARTAAQSIPFGIDFGPEHRYTWLCLFAVVVTAFTYACQRWKFGKTTLSWSQKRGLLRT